MNTPDDGARASIESGRANLGIELGSTRIKICLVGENPSSVLAVGAHEWENEFVDGMWTYSLDSVWTGVQAAFTSLLADIDGRYGVTPRSFGAIGVSAMMHGYLAFDDDDQLLVPFRTWRNSSTGAAAVELTELFGVNIPLRWSIAHLHQAVRDAEPHVPEVRFVTTLAGYVHWKLTGKKVLGVGDASGMFPIDPSTNDFDQELLARYDRLAEGTSIPAPLRQLLPQVHAAGELAGQLTPEGAVMLDVSGGLHAGVAFCPPEGDAGTGMVATNSISPRTGNVSAGTSIFAMVVLERPLLHAHDEVDVVTTPVGDPVAMVHCNNGASELAAWVGMFQRFAQMVGSSADADAVYDALFAEALSSEADAGGLLAYNHLAGEPIAGLTAGRPLFVRTPDSRLTLANMMRAQLYGVFGTLSLGMRVLAAEGVHLDRMYAHGGMFRTAGVAQRFLAAALNTPVAVTETAAEGGAWGMAVLAAYTSSGARTDLATYLRDVVFASTEPLTAQPEPADVTGFASYLTRYSAGLEIERTAITALP